MHVCYFSFALLLFFHYYCNSIIFFLIIILSISSLSWQFSPVTMLWSSWWWLLSIGCLLCSVPFLCFLFCFFCISVFDTIEQYAPGFKDSVIDRDILSPPDLERIFGLTGGVSGHSVGLQWSVQVSFLKYLLISIDLWCIRLSSFLHGDKVFWKVHCKCSMFY